MNQDASVWQRKTLAWCTGSKQHRSSRGCLTQTHGLDLRADVLHGVIDRGQASDIEIQAREMMRLREWLEDTISKHSKRSVAEINKDIDRDKILTAPEALEFGLIDQVLTSRKNA